MKTRIVFLYITVAFPLALCAMEDTKTPAIPTEDRPYFVMYTDTDENAPQPTHATIQPNGISLNPSQLIDSETEHQTPQRSWRTFAKNNWRKIVGTTALAGYVAYYAKYNPEALTEVCAWAKNSWLSLPQFFKPLIKVTIAGIALNKTYTYFFKKPLIANPNNEKFVTFAALEKYCGDTMRKADEVLNAQKLMANVSLRIMQQDPYVQEIMKGMGNTQYPTDDQSVPQPEAVD